jgi:hypothetical protein
MNKISNCSKYKSENELQSRRLFIGDEENRRDQFEDGKQADNNALLFLSQAL